jgi:hypothetical protein
MSLAAVTRELLVRYLDVWTPAALHTARRVTFAYAWSAEADAGTDDATAHAETTEAALRGFAEFDDLLRSRRLTYVIVGPGAGGSDRLEAVQAELKTSANLAVHAVSGEPETLLPTALGAAGASGAPLLVFSHAATPPARLHGAGRPTELISVLPPDDWATHRDALHRRGFELTTGVEFAATRSAAGSAATGSDDQSAATGSAATRSGGAASDATGSDDQSGRCLVGFATGRANSLDAFKNALWAVDEYAGVRYRDPNDPNGRLQDISLAPHPGPLRRALLDRLTSIGPQTVTQLRHYTLTDTIYRSSDATRVISSLRHTGAVTSGSAHGRLSGDAVVEATSASSRPTR